MGENLRENERVKRTVAAESGDHQLLTIENISRRGGYLKGNKHAGGTFSLSLLLNNYKKVDLKCISRWNDEKGLGFEIVKVEKNKEDLFNEFVDRQIALTKMYGNDRVFRKEIFISLGETNATGNVYFANYVKYQGLLREQCIVKHVPNINEIMMQTGIRLVTVDVYQKFKVNAYFGDTLIGELTLAQIQGCKAKLKFRYRNKETGVLIGEGYQQFCCVDSTGKVLKMPKLFEFMEYYIET